MPSRHAPPLARTAHRRAHSRSGSSPPCHTTRQCDKDDDACLQRKRRLAAEEFRNFRINPLSSPPMLVFAVLPVMQGLIGATRIAASVIKKL